MMARNRTPRIADGEESSHQDEPGDGTPAAAPGGARAVSRFEAGLLRMLRSFLRPHPGEPVAAAPAAGKLAIPAGLSDACVDLVQDSLAKGCVLYLARAGGWRRERHLRDGQALEGRLWERTPVPDLGLSFSRHSMTLLVWLAAGRPDKAQQWDPPAAELTAGDLLLTFLAYEGLRETDAGESLRGRPQIAGHGLARLIFPEDFVGGAAAEAKLDFAPWVRGAGAAIVEALQPRLRQRLLALERAKAQVGDWAKMRATGQSQEQALAAFLAACEQARRPDLARFLLRAMAELLSRDLKPAFWIGGLQSAGAPARLADRLDTQRQGLAVLRQVERLAGWARGYGGTRFFDEEYATAQLWLADWEQYRGEELAAIAQHLLRQLEPLRLSAPVARSDAAGGQSVVSSQ